MNLNNAISPQQGAQLKAIGLVSGVADLSAVSSAGTFIGIEFKVGADKQSKAQQAHAAAIQALGAEYHEVRSFEEFCTLWERIHPPTD